MAKCLIDMARSMEDSRDLLSVSSLKLATLAKEREILS